MAQPPVPAKTCHPVAVSPLSPLLGVGNLIMTTTEDANKPLVIADGKLAEHWDVIQDEADQTHSRNGVSMFGDIMPRTSRVVMAPLTRCRATNPDLLPTDVQARYYSQRASAGLIITKGTWHDVPGIFTRRPGARLVSFLCSSGTPARRRIGTSSTATVRFRAFRLQRFSRPRGAWSS